MEEVFLPQRNDFIVDPVQKRLISFGDCRCNGILAAKGRNAYGISGILQCIGDDFSIVIGPGDCIAVLQRILCIRIGIILLKLYLGVVGSEVSFRCGAGYHNDLIVSADLIEACDNAAVGRYNTESDVHVRKCKIYLLCSFFGYREVCEHDIYLACFEIFNTACGFGRNVVDLNAEILAYALCEVYVIALIFAVLVNITERVLVGEYADIYCAARLYLVECAVDRFGIICCAACCGSCFAGRRNRRGAACDPCDTEGEQQSCCDRS